MSSPEPFSLELSPKAQQDFVDILRYTGERWGNLQLLAYRHKLDAALQAIRFNPHIGHRRDDLPADYLAFPVGAHVIVFRIEIRRIGVVRILHERMAIGRHV